MRIFMENHLVKLNIYLVFYIFDEDDAVEIWSHLFPSQRILFTSWHTCVKLLTVTKQNRFWRQLHRTCLNKYFRYDNEVYSGGKLKPRDHLYNHVLSSYFSLVFQLEKPLRCHTSPCCFNNSRQTRLSLRKIYGQNLIFPMMPIHWSISFSRNTCQGSDRAHWPYLLMVSWTAQLHPQLAAQS